jgi:hypothetical protein
VLRDCHYAISWASQRSVPPCPPCNGRATHVWLDYRQGEARAQFGPDLFLCSRHASWLMERTVEAIRNIVLIAEDSPPPPPAQEAGGGS